MIIALIGVDGSGKSSLSNRLENYFLDLGCPAEVIYMGRGRNRALPGVRNSARKVGVSLPHPETLNVTDGVPYKMLRILRDFSYLIDGFARYLCFIYPRKRNGVIVITDRYAYDILLNRKIRPYIKKILLAAYPKPDLMVHLFNEPEVVLERKGQHDVKELQRQLNVLHDLKHDLEKKNYFRMIELKTVSEEDTFQEVIQYLQKIKAC